jgi:hypothetical protein
MDRADEKKRNERKKERENVGEKMTPFVGMDRGGELQEMKIFGDQLSSIRSTTTIW